MINLITQLLADYAHATVEKFCSAGNSKFGVCVYVFLNRSLFLFTTTIQIYSLAGIYTFYGNVYTSVSIYADL